MGPRVSVASRKPTLPRFTAVTACYTTSQGHDPGIPQPRVQTCRLVVLAAFRRGSVFQGTSFKNRASVAEASVVSPVHLADTGPYVVDVGCGYRDADLRPQFWQGGVLQLQTRLGRKPVDDPV